MGGLGVIDDVGAGQKMSAISTLHTDNENRKIESVQIYKQASM